MEENLESQVFYEKISESIKKDIKKESEDDKKKKVIKK